MMLPSHLLGTLLLGGLAGLGRPLRPREWALALGFGVAIDLDHTFQFPAYVASHGWQGLTAGAMLAWGGAWQGVFHTPWALLPVAAAAIFFRSWVPPVFWALHMVQDFVIARHYVRFGSPVEWLIDVALLLVVAGVLHLEWRAAGKPSWRSHLRARFGLRVPEPAAAAET